MVRDVEAVGKVPCKNGLGGTGVRLCCRCGLDSDAQKMHGLAVVVLGAGRKIQGSRASVFPGIDVTDPGIVKSGMLGFHGEGTNTGPQDGEDEDELAH